MRERMRAAGDDPDGDKLRSERRISVMPSERVALWEGVDGR